MKKYFFVLITLAFAAQINAQSNLVFNQVLILELTTQPSVEANTVPDGKVWKIEGSNSGGSSNGQFVTSSPNGVVTYWSNSTGSKVFPIWLPSGFSVYYSNNNAAATRLSVLEFNVVAVSSGSGTVNTAVDDFTYANGTSFGDEYTPGETITDNDGNVYETVTIGPQTWTTSNLDVSTYRDGTPISHITDFNEWQTTTTGAYTYVNQDGNSIYGKVYNVWAVIGKHDNDPNTPHKELAPEGYHVSTYFEWNSLKQYFGGDPYAANYLRSELGWSRDMNGNNESGLNILPGYCVSGGTNSISTNNGFESTSGDWLLESSHYATSSMINSYGLKGVRVGQHSVDLTSYEFRNYDSSKDGYYVRLLKN